MEGDHQQIKIFGYLIKLNWCDIGKCSDPAEIKPAMEKNKIEPSGSGWVKRELNESSFISKSECAGEVVRARQREYERNG